MGNLTTSIDHATAEAEARLCERICALLIATILDGKTPRKRYRTLLAIEASGEALAARAAGRANVYAIRGGSPETQDARREEDVDAGFTVQRVAGQLLSLTAQRMFNREGAPQ